MRFINKNRNTTLRIYSVTSKEIAQYHSTNTAAQKQRGTYDMPNDDTRLGEKEIKGEEEYNKDLLAKRAAGGA